MRAGNVFDRKVIEKEGEKKKNVTFVHAKVQLLNTLITVATASTADQIGGKYDDHEHGQTSTNDDRNQIGILLNVLLTDFL